MKPDDLDPLLPTLIDREQLCRDGHGLLRGAIPAAWLDGLRAAFDAGVQPSSAWPVPRGLDWRHALVDLDPTVMAVCRLPVLLAAVGELVRERFFLSQVEGREPLANGGHQMLHRDLSARRPGDSVVALATSCCSMPIWFMRRARTTAGRADARCC